MKISSITADQLRKARKSGYKRKKPKKPSAKSSLTTLENWILRYNEWVRGAKESIAKRERKEKEEEKRKKLLQSIKRT